MTTVMEPAPRSHSRRKSAEPPAAKLRVERGADGSLTAIKDGARTEVRVCRCFPWSKPSCFISLRDEKDNEVALIEQLSELEADSRAAIEEAMAQAGFVMEIESIISAEEVYEVRAWKVQTKQGPRTFQTKLDVWPREIASGGYLIHDVAGDVFRIAKPESMDAKSQKILWTMVD